NPNSDSNYYTWEISGTKRLNDRWSMLAAFGHTWSDDQGRNYFGNSVRQNTYPQTPNDLINAGSQGQYVFRGWGAKLHGTWEGPRGLRVTPIRRHHSGLPASDDDRAAADSANRSQVHFLIGGFMHSRSIWIVTATAAVAVSLAAAPAQTPSTSPGPAQTASKPAANPKLDQYKKDVAAEIDGTREFTQQMVDQVFSFGELGFQEIETSKYLTGILKKNGFTVQEGIAGIPTAWMASWGSGKPILALGSDIDCIPQASQKPGVAYHDPLIEGAPGHGEGHNSGVPLNITAT